MIYLKCTIGWNAAAKLLSEKYNLQYFAFNKINTNRIPTIVMLVNTNIFP